MIKRISFLLAIIIGSAFAQQTDLSKLFASNDEFLEVDQAFSISLAGYADEVIATYTIADGYYLYQHRLKVELKGAKLGEIIIPEGKRKVDEYFGEVQTYTKELTFGIPFSNADSFLLELEFQGCADAGLCYPPTSRFFKIDVATNNVTAIEESDYSESDLTASNRWSGPPLASNEPFIAANSQVSMELSTASQNNFVSEKDKIINTLNDSSILFGFFSLIALGIGLAFTPCVFPMMPIISSIIAGQGSHITSSKAFLLSVTYTQAMAIPYVIIGFVVAGVGASATATLQSPPFVIGAAIVFLILSLGMFGFYEIQLPSALQNKLNNVSHQQQSGTYIGAAIMGVISGAVVSPCVTIPLIAVLTWISQVGDAVVGAIYLYGLAIGMGIPLILIGVGGGKLLPNAGAWMNAVKSVFGVMMIAVALYITKHLFSPSIYLALWGALIIICSIYLGALASLEHSASGWEKLWKGVGVVALIYGSTLVIGATQGNSSLLNPLANSQVGSQNKVNAQSNNPHGDFILIKTVDDLDRYLAKAQKENKTVMLDFFAEYCAACYEFAELTFPAPIVQQALSNTILLQADVTAGDAEDKALMNRFKIYGLPSILFFDNTGREISSLRAEGFEDAETFALRIEAAFDL